jgi:hypothetical protein
MMDLRKSRCHSCAITLSTDSSVLLLRDCLSGSASLSLVQEGSEKRPEENRRGAINSGSTTLPASDHSLSAMPPTAFAASRPGTQPTSSSLVAKPPLATNPKTVIVRGPLPPEIAVVVCVDDSARMTERWPDVVRPGGYLDKCIEKLMLSVGGGGKVSPAFLACVGGRRRLDRLSKGRGGGRGRLARLANHEAWGTRSPAWRTYG